MTKLSYTPGQVADPVLAEELRRISQALGSRELNSWEVLHAAPAKPRVGIVYLADGSDWDPVSTGELTPVWFDGSAWKEIGSGGTGSEGPPGPQGPQGPQGAQGPEASPIVGINLQTGTSYILQAADAGLCVEMNNASANSVTVPLGVFAVGMQLQIRQVGAGQTSISPDVGVTVRTPSTLRVRGQWSTVALHQRASNEWVLMGDVE